VVALLQSGLQRRRYFLQRLFRRRLGLDRYLPLQEREPEVSQRPEGEAAPTTLLHPQRWSGVAVEERL
jgi:hypothetical protein